MNRNLGSEIDQLKLEMNKLQKLVGSYLGEASKKAFVMDDLTPDKEQNEGNIYYSGQYRNGHIKYKWDAKEQPIRGLLNLDGEKMAKILSALGNKQRLDILRSVIKGPVAGTELVEKLNMGTTGQLYHHIKALMGADLLVQEERGGSYSLPSHRVLPVLLLLAASSELADTTTYMDMADAREHPDLYLGAAGQAYDPHLLIWALLENTILEHQVGSCTEVHIFFHNERSLTVADNGRGIPITVLSNRERPHLQTVMTDIGQASLSAPYYAAGGEKGISVAIVNALSYQLAVEIRREGTIYRQDYKQGIPQSGIIKVGVTEESGTSITLEPDPDLFLTGFDIEALQKRAIEIQGAYPNLAIHILR
ncbi:ArsR family transcriptional regulator [Paenibacillus sp. S3N08]|uniref:DNA topoisomerase (ATP-hydrolyzing) n=1 Tax=Paenibacillus agricola TaxID=2716264 RepID=A0ABX0IXJ9_9BACL|nr:ArsR family transcriptional regulator [Paenibacillus agricola]